MFSPANSIFAGTAVLCNYLLMITWLPASVALVERLSCLSPQWCYTRFIQVVFDAINRTATAVQELVIRAICDWPLVWIVLLATSGVYSGVVVFYRPRLQLPDSPDFKLFDAAHPFELYDSHYRNMFSFEKSPQVSGVGYKKAISIGLNKVLGIRRPFELKQIRK